jgi:ribosome-associated toxin RatA of RatAB toxin-antitoxin module
MKELSAAARTSVRASPEQCVALFSAVDRYPNWHPDVIPRAEVLERDPGGVPTRVHATVKLAAGPMSRQFELEMSVAVEPSRQVRLTRVADDDGDNERFDVTWRIEPAEPTRIELLLATRLDVPRFLPVGSIGESVAQGFVDAARGALEGSSANASASSS